VLRSERLRSTSAAMASANIPLHCSICPKRPNFSDVSHLLTHIASKGHLSNYYKVKVRSGNDDAARRLVESYDRWYTEWNVEDLMSERMTQKDKRRSRARPVGTRRLPASLRNETRILISNCRRQSPRPSPVRAAIDQTRERRFAHTDSAARTRAAAATASPLWCSYAVLARYRFTCV
jgi:hypothetical protein